MLADGDSDDESLLGESVELVDVTELFETIAEDDVARPRLAKLREVGISRTDKHGHRGGRMRP